jgi:hypothetical protein
MIAIRSKFLCPRLRGALILVHHLLKSPLQSERRLLSSLLVTLGKSFAYRMYEILPIFWMGLLYSLSNMSILGMNFLSSLRYSGHKDNVKALFLGTQLHHPYDIFHKIDPLFRRILPFSCLESGCSLSVYPIRFGAYAQSRFTDHKERPRLF